MTEPLVSIIIPTYYRDEQLRQAIESAIGQEYENIEIIVVDDSGEEYAAPIASEYMEVEFIAHETNQGGNPARNTGFTASEGKYIQLLDDDDEIHPQKIAKQVKLLESNPAVGVAYAGITDRTGSDIHPNPPAGDTSLERALQFQWSTTITSSLLIARSVFSEAYPLTSRKAADDIGMKIELAKHTEFEFIDEILTNIGESENNRSTSPAFVEELQNIFNEYRSLYETSPDFVTDAALSHIYWLKGNELVMEKKIPFIATPSYLKALQHKGELDLVLLGSLIASCFGEPGFRLGTFIRKRYNF